FQKFRGTEFRALEASVDDGPNVELSLTPSLCEDVFWRLPHLIYPSLSARSRLRVSRSADHFEADRRLPSRVHFAPNKEQNKRTDNRHDETGGVISTADNITIKTFGYTSFEISWRWCRSTMLIRA